MEEYSKVVFNISVDLKFWDSFLPTAIEAYKNAYPSNIRYFESGLYAYNMTLDDNSGWLYSLKKTAVIGSENIHESKESFFEWVQIISLVRIYNSLESLLYNMISSQYFTPSKSKKITNKDLKTRVLGELKTAAIKHDTKNNKFLIAYIKFRSTNADQFLRKTVRDLPYTWEGFFNFMSIIRHIIVHDAMEVSSDNFNMLNSEFPLLVDRYLQIKNTESKSRRLTMDDSKQGLENLISLCNDFAYNLVKFVVNVERIDV
jgi:hypothetical protein